MESLIYIPIWLFYYFFKKIIYPFVCNIYIPIWLFYYARAGFNILAASSIYIPIWLFYYYEDFGYMWECPEFTFQFGYFTIGLILYIEITML